MIFTHLVLKQLKDSSLLCCSLAASINKRKEKVLQDIEQTELSMDSFKGRFFSGILFFLLVVATSVDLKGKRINASAAFNKIT